MRKVTMMVSWMLALSLLVFTAGCSRQLAPGTSPFVVSTNPAPGATGVPKAQVVSATFSVAMQSSTISASSFTLAGPGTTAVAGAVAYNSTNNTATFTPTSGLAPNTLYTGTITTSAQSQQGIGLSANYTWTFTTGAAPTVVSTVPANNATGVAINQIISAGFSEGMDPTTIISANFTVTGAGGIAVAGTVTFNGSSNTVVFTPTSGLTPNTLYTATITTGVKSTGEFALASNYVWSFTTGVSPSVISTVPANGATGVSINQIVRATFSEAMNAATITPSTFTLTGPGSTSVTGFVSYDATTVTAIFAPSSSLAPNAIYTATITIGAQSTAGFGLAGNYVWSFRTSPTPPAPPTVTATVPANAAAGVPINQKITAAFSEAMNPATINTTTFTLAGPGGTAVTGAVTYIAAGSIATFTPVANLAASTTYIATITTGAQDLSVPPDGLVNNYVWSFTTAAAPATTHPTVISTIPVNLAAGVPTNQAISATFSGAMDPATINSTTFTLTAPGGGTVNGLVTYALGANTATFSPIVNLAPSTTYQATITTGAADLAGNALANNYGWSFTTAAAPTVIAPTVVSTNPISNAAGVPVTATVNATFSQAMDPTTMTTATFTVEGPGGTAVTGAVTYNVASQIATFTPLTNLAVSTTYQATITTGATNLAGIPLAANYVWSFTTGAVVVPPPSPLGTAALFGGMGGGLGMTNMGIETVINGNIGTTGASTTMTGFHDLTVSGTPPPCSYIETPLNIGLVNGTIDTAPPPPTIGCPNEGTAATLAIAAKAEADAQSEYNALATMPPGFACPGAGNGAGLTLLPGTYTCATTFKITLGDLTLDAGGNPNAVWVFQIGTALTVGDVVPRNVILINGAQPQNVYWQVGSFATINGAGGGTFEGTVLAVTGASTGTAGIVTITRVCGRLIGLAAGPVTIVNTHISLPPAAGDCATGF